MLGKDIFLKILPFQKYRKIHDEKMYLNPFGSFFHNDHVQELKVFIHKK